MLDNTNQVSTLSNLARAAVIDVVKSEESTGKKYRKLADVFHADGIRGDDLQTVKKGGNAELRQSTKDAIYMGFTEADRTLALKDVKTLDDVEKMKREKIRDRADIMLGRIRAYLLNDESEGTGEAQESKTVYQRMHAQLDAILTKLQAIESPNFDVVETVKRIKLGKSLIPSI